MAIVSSSELQPGPALVAAYGVPSDDMGAVAAVIYGRLFEPASVTISVDTVRELPVEWRAILQVLGMLIFDSRAFARVRGGGRPSKATRKTMARMVAAYPLSRPAEQFLDEVLADISSTLARWTSEQRSAE